MKDKNRILIEWKVRSGFGAPADGVWTEYCIVESDRKPGKAGEANMIVAALNAWKETNAFEYRLEPQNQKEK